MLFSTTSYTTGFSDKGYLRMVGSLLNITNTVLMELSDSTLLSGLHRGAVLGWAGLGVLTSCEDSMTHHSPGLLTTLKVTFCSSLSFRTTRKHFFFKCLQPVFGFQIKQQATHFLWTPLEPAVWCSYLLAENCPQISVISWVLFFGLRQRCRTIPIMPLERYIFK